MKNQIIKILFGVALVAVCATGCGKNQKNAAGEEISVVSREDGSGTRGAFIELFGIEEEDENGEKDIHEYKISELHFKPKRKKKNNQTVQDAELKALEELERKEGKSKL